ncbi:MAG TPA: hypothetical protein VF077_09795 [Nitrospiraceae bacterium]
MKPSDIVLSMPPLTACFNKTEAECAAALMVWYCQTHGDEWQTITPKQVGQAMKEELAKDPIPEPIRSWNRNPFFRVDMRRLSADGFITPIDDSHNQPLAFTELGLKVLEKSVWNKKREV